jgi:hypothetical protein
MTQSATRCTAADRMMLVIRVYDAARNVIEKHKHEGDFKESLFGVKIDWNSAQQCTVDGCLIG